LPYHLRRIVAVRLTRLGLAGGFMIRENGRFSVNATKNRPR
jgi:hypothetical protein